MSSPAGLRLDNKPNGTMLLHHLSMMHPAAVKPYLDRMRTEDIGTVAMEAFERVNLPPPPLSIPTNPPLPRPPPATVPPGGFASDMCQCKGTCGY
jgi:hypothetical protein